MGREIDSEHFDETDFDEFRDRLRKETAVMKGWFDHRAFHYAETYTVGLELEAWLLDENALPAPVNQEFLAAANHRDIVEELSAFNVEINAPPAALEGEVFSQTESNLKNTWSHCQKTAGDLGVRAAMMGILPTVRDEMLQLEWMSDTNRYKALNEQLMRRRNSEPLHIDIRGHDHLDYKCNHIMLEAGCTSLQAHIKVNQEDCVRFYNASILAAAPLVAATANSPFLYGKSLWCETRIPAFEQATALDGFRDAAGRNVQRVTMGTGYLRHSFLELFMQNLSFPVLLPALEDDAERLPHLQLQNGTIWRWVRPILGFDKTNTPHLRIEHRVMPAGPSLIDTVANLALCHGMVLSLARASSPPEEYTRFEEARQNFYACAKDGLDAQVVWEGRTMNVQSLLLDKLIPDARAALQSAGISSGDIAHYIDGVIVERVRSGRTGAAWQRSFTECNSANFQALTERYVDLQDTNAPSTLGKCNQFMPLKLNQFDQLPSQLADIDVREIRTVFPNPALIHIQGELDPPVFVSTLLHGNETTSFSVLQFLQQKVGTETPRRSLMIFVGNVAATESGTRLIEGEPDFNRIWAPGDTEHHALAAEVLSIARTRGIFASIDIHNNTGRNPVYGCINSLRPQDLYLAAAFAPLGVYYLNPPTTQSIAFSHLGPAITLECGQAGDKDGLAAAIKLIDHVLELGEFPAAAPAAGSLELFETVGRVLVAPDMKISFGASTSADLVFRPNLEDLNFQNIERGSVWATNTHIENGLKVVDEHGRDLTDHFFHRAKNDIILDQSIVPAMITSDTEIIRQDCLCYLMKPLAWHADR